MRTVLSFLVIFAVTKAFRLTNVFLRTTRVRGAIPGFEAKNVEDLMKKMGPTGSTTDKKSASDPAAYNALSIGEEVRVKDAIVDDKEKVFRMYQFQNLSLPVLPDCNNYFSGAFRNMFWHQNQDEVFVYIPIPENIERNDVDVKFGASFVKLFISGMEIFSFPCIERIIPDGSFWMFDRDKDGQRYIHLDLEKRHRMINWKGIFGQFEHHVAPVVTERQNKILDQMYEANKGLAKLSGLEPESIRDMMANGEFTKMITDKQFGPPVATIHDEDGYPVQTGTPEELGIPWDKDNKPREIDWEQVKLTQMFGHEVEEVKIPNGTNSEKDPEENGEQEEPEEGTEVPVPAEIEVEVDVDDDPTQSDDGIIDAEWSEENL